MECVCVKNSVYVLKATASILAVQLMTSDPWGQDGTCFPELMRINNFHMYTDLKHNFIIFKIKNCDFFFFFLTISSCANLILATREQLSPCQLESKFQKRGYKLREELNVELPKH